MKNLLIIFILCSFQLSFANMASPIREGTYASNAFSSRDIDILKEKIHVTPDKDFNTASYVIEYFIRTETDGKQVPLLFHALDFSGDFRVWVDGKETILLDFPADYKSGMNSPFEKFSNAFSQASKGEEEETVTIFWRKNSGNVYPLHQLKYFETDLSKGEHTIRVEYVSNVWLDVSGWVNAYSFRYSLSPAKHWKSFGSLEITVDASKLTPEYSTNIGQPASRNTAGIAVWNFSKLPADYFEITYIPKISSFPQAMIHMGPQGLTIICSILLIILHLWGINLFRKRNPLKKYSWVVAAGSIINTFLFMLAYIMSYEWIDMVIGPEAGNYHGYPFMIMFLYPLILPVYWLAMWWVDRMIKRRMTSV